MIRLAKGAQWLMVGEFALIVVIVSAYESGDYSTKNKQQSNKNWYDVPLIKTTSHQ